jgi:hypothetical protein
MIFVFLSLKLKTHGEFGISTDIIRSDIAIS